MPDHGGRAIGVMKPGSDASQWSRQHRILENRRVQNLVEADYTEEGELMRSLCLAVEMQSTHARTDTAASEPAAMAVLKVRIFGVFEQVVWRIRQRLGVGEVGSDLDRASSSSSF